MKTETTTETKITLTIEDLKEILCEKFKLNSKTTYMSVFTEFEDYSEDHIFAGIILKTVR
jgi:hypothetical protein